jgi:hypothetical protein
MGAEEWVGGSVNLPRSDLGWVGTGGCKGILTVGRVRGWVGGCMCTVGLLVLRFLDVC